MKLNVNSVCECCRKSRDKEDKQPYLKWNSPAYRNINIDLGIAQQLSDDGDLLNQVTTIADSPQDDSGLMNVVPPILSRQADVDIDLPPVSTIVPNLLVEQSER